MINLRDQILKSQIAYYNGLIAKLNAIAQAHEKIEIINHYFLNR